VEDNPGKSTFADEFNERIGALEIIFMDECDKAEIGRELPVIGERVSSKYETGTEQRIGQRVRFVGPDGVFLHFSQKEFEIVVLPALEALLYRVRRME
jgi:hypothetical protein